MIQLDYVKINNLSLSFAEWKILASQKYSRMSQALSFSTVDLMHFLVIMFYLKSPCESNREPAGKRLIYKQKWGQHCDIQDSTAICDADIQH